MPPYDRLLTYVSSVYVLLVLLSASPTGHPPDVIHILSSWSGIIVSAAVVLRRASHLTQAASSPHYITIPKPVMWPKCYLSSVFSDASAFRIKFF